MAFHPLVVKYKPWSVSKLGVLEGCTRQFHWKHVERRREAGSGGAARIGVAVHGMLEDRLGTTQLDDEQLLKKHAEKEQLTSEELKHTASFLLGIESFVKRIEVFEKKQNVGVRRVEHKLGIRDDFTACDFNDPECLIRGVIDYCAEPGSGTVVVIDHKSGKRKSIDQHALQLNTYMLFIVAHFPEATAVQCGIHYVGDPDLSWMEPHPRSHIQQKIQPWMEYTLNRQASRLEMIDTNRADPQTGWRCEYCGFIEECREGQEEVARRQARRGGTSL